MFTFFYNRTQNLPLVSADSRLFNLIALLLSAPLIEAQRGGGGHGGGFGGGSYGHGYGGGSGSCDSKCLKVIGGTIAVLLLFVCLVAIIYKKCKKNSSQIDNSSLISGPYENAHLLLNHTVAVSSISTTNNLGENSDLIEFLKLNPSTLNSLWEGTYSDSGIPGLVGKFHPKLRFKWNEQKNLMAFETFNDEQDDYGQYRIIGNLNFENGNFVAHKYYFNPSQQTTPYNIVQEGHIKFISKEDQLYITASGAWYSSYKNSVKGTFEYSKAIQELTLTEEQKSYGTFLNV
ncbi:hypothetical protein OQJ26_19080 [Legionella sp. PATHC038]|uniref:hypothetical protein n=1 Tax=Legionella sheltonii TaxID=2992041 RepID=UPI0022439C91|nr:hypothetical protein [Legionella sp. PATHC038]MCW8400890.1 hypothetical protein [Legionella sp. PATHC038]